MFRFFIFQTFLICIWLSPAYSVNKVDKIYKKQAVTWVIRSVSLLFYQHNTLDNQKQEQKSRGIRLGTDDEKKRAKGIQPK